LIGHCNGQPGDVGTNSSQSSATTDEEATTHQNNEVQL
jgi:hypothetical protein